jgi:ornithine cyclodeaminase/alanine dehydrogenase-like protein (mu-crystallin family)
MRILTAKEIRSAITMPEAIEAVRDGFLALSLGRAKAPLRSVLETSGGITLTMPAYITGDPISTVKVVSVYPDNSEKDLPVVIGTVLVVSAITGAPIALLDGTSLTAIRTGAASGLATDLLSRLDSTVLGVIGTGVQARTQVEAVCAVRTITEIRLFGLDGTEAMADELRALHDANIIVSESAHDALAGADIVVAATNSKTPVVYGADISPGVHINGIGSFTPQMQEVAADIVVRAKVVVDHRESVWAEAGDLIIPRDAGLISEKSIHAEIGEVAAGAVKGRANPDEITFFKSVGNAVQDAVVARCIITAAEERGFGTEVEL